MAFVSFIKHSVTSFFYRNIFGPALGSSPAQNPPVLPSMQPGFGGAHGAHYYNDAYRNKKTFTSCSFSLNTHFMAVFHLAVPSTNPFVAGAIPPEMATNPFQTNGRAPAAGVYALRV